MKIKENVTAWDITCPIGAPGTPVLVHVEIPDNYQGETGFEGRPDICDDCPPAQDGFEYTLPAMEIDGAAGEIKEYFLPFVFAHEGEPGAKELVVYSAKQTSSGTKKEKMKSLGSVKPEEIVKKK